MNPFTRRSFLKGLGTSALATAASGLRAADVPAPPPEMGGRVNLSLPVRFR